MPTATLTESFKFYIFCSWDVQNQLQIQVLEDLVYALL